MDKQYYREYFALEREHWWFRARSEILMGHLRTMVKSRGPLKILNVGAATGRSTELLGQFGKVTSVEYDGDCCEFTRSNTGLELTRASITTLPFRDEEFDLVCAFDVIEHVEDDATAVSEMTRVCSTGGLVCVTVPAFMFLWSHHDHINHHCRRYTGQGLREVLRKTRMRSVFQSYFNFWLFFPIALYRIVERWRKPVQREDAGSDFFAMRNKMLDRLLYVILRTEGFLLDTGLRLPVGVSILSTWRKETR